MVCLKRGVGGGLSARWERQWARGLEAGSLDAVDTYVGFNDITEIVLVLCSLPVARVVFCCPGCVCKCRRARTQVNFVQGSRN